MKKVLLGGALLLITSLSASAMTQTIAFGSTGSISFAPVGGGGGFTFSFPNHFALPGDQIVNAGATTPALVDDTFFADIAGSWTVASVGACVPASAGCQFGTVTGGNPGSLTIFDDFTAGGITAALSFSDIRSITTSGNTTGTVQVSATLNVGAFSNSGGYAGGNADLEALKTYSGGHYFITFNPSGGATLSSFLTTPLSSSFSATLTMVPEPSFYSMMLAPAVAGILFFARKRKQVDNV